MVLIDSSANTTQVSATSSNGGSEFVCSEEPSPSAPDAMPHATDSDDPSRTEPTRKARNVNLVKPPERSQVVNRLVKIQDYIQQTTTLMNTLKDSEDEHRRAQYDKLSVMVDELRDSESKLLVIVKSLDDFNDEPISVEEGIEVAESSCDKKQESSTSSEKAENTDLSPRVEKAVKLQGIREDNAIDPRLVAQLEGLVANMSSYRQRGLNIPSDLLDRVESMANQRPSTGEATELSNMMALSCTRPSRRTDEGASLSMDFSQLSKQTNGKHSVCLSELPLSLSCATQKLIDPLCISNEMDKPTHTAEELQEMTRQIQKQTFDMHNHASTLAAVTEEVKVLKAALQLRKETNMQAVGQLMLSELRARKEEVEGMLKNITTGAGSAANQDAGFSDAASDKSDSPGVPYAEPHDNVRSYLYTDIQKLVDAANNTKQELYPRNEMSDDIHRSPLVAEVDTTRGIREDHVIDPRLVAQLEGLVANMSSYRQRGLNIPSDLLDRVESMANQRPSTAEATELSNMMAQACTRPSRRNDDEVSLSTDSSQAASPFSQNSKQTNGTASTVCLSKHSMSPNYAIRKSSDRVHISNVIDEPPDTDDELLEITRQIKQQTSDMHSHASTLATVSEEVKVLKAALQLRKETNMQAVGQQMLSELRARKEEVEGMLKNITTGAGSAANQDDGFSDAASEKSDSPACIPTSRAQFAADQSSANSSVDDASESETGFAGERTMPQTAVTGPKQGRTMPGSSMEVVQPSCEDSNERLTQVQHLGPANFSSFSNTDVKNLIDENMALRHQNLSLASTVTQLENTVSQLENTVTQYENTLHQYEARYGPLGGEDDSSTNAETAVDLQSMYSYIQALNENLQAMTATNDSANRLNCPARPQRDRSCGPRLSEEKRVSATRHTNLTAFQSQRATIPASQRQAAGPQVPAFQLPLHETHQPAYRAPGRQGPAYQVHERQMPAYQVHECQMPAYQGPVYLAPECQVPAYYAPERQALPHHMPAYQDPACSRPVRQAVGYQESAGGIATQVESMQLGDYHPSHNGIRAPARICRSVPVSPVPLNKTRGDVQADVRRLRPVFDFETGALIGHCAGPDPEPAFSDHNVIPATRALGPLNPVRQFVDSWHQSSRESSRVQNSQVPSGNRTNNYVENVRSNSQQNLLPETSYSARSRSRARSNEADCGNSSAHGNAHGRRNVNRRGYVNPRDARWSCDRDGVDQQSIIDQRWSGVTRERRPVTEAVAGNAHVPHPNLLGEPRRFYHQR